jgi:subtilisin family serine protease
MFINRLFLGVFLASHAAAIGRTLNEALGEAQVEDVENPGPLRGGGKFNNGKSTIISPQAGRPERENTKRVRSLSFDAETIGTGDGDGDDQADDTDNDVKHVIITCKKEEEELVCKKRILDAIPKESRDLNFRLNTYLKLPNAYAAEVRGDSSILDALEGDVFADPPRETMHIKESIQVHRKLQGGQQTPYGIAMVKAMDVWEKYNNKGENVRVCVMDTGVNRDHPDLDESRLFGYEGDELVQPWWRDVDGHGTHVSGTIAASDNTQGVVGVAPGAEIFTARVFSTNGQFYSSNIITALQVCKDGGAQVISMSLGGPYAVSYELQAYTDLYEKFGIVTVAASGNTGGTDLLYPASYDNVISVGSVNWNSDRSSFSTKNSKVDVAAPGSSIVSYKSQEFGSCWIEHLSLLEKAIVLPVRFLLSLVAKHMGKRKLRHYQRNIHVVPTCFWCGCTHAECQSVCHSIAGLCCVGKILRESQHYWKRR